MPSNNTTPFFDGSVTNTPEMLAAGSRDIHYLHVINPNSLDSYVQLFDTATIGAITLGTTTPTLVFIIPAGGATSSGAWDTESPFGLHFKYGIAYAATTTATGSTAPSTALKISGAYV